MYSSNPRPDNGSLMQLESHGTVPEALWGFFSETIPPVGLLIRQGDPRVGTFDFDPQKSGINSEAVAKSVVEAF